VEQNTLTYLPTYFISRRDKPRPPLSTAFVNGVTFHGSVRVKTPPRWSDRVSFVATLLGVTQRGFSLGGNLRESIFRELYPAIGETALPVHKEHERNLLNFVETG